ncbi:DNA repair protein RecO [Psychrobacter sp. BF1]|uniref:DNA repair protein RecO n=1 Tax=Psychrobacter sp. BF1 TaxID=2821147 RepID=UPI001C4E2174|nr:DNA repair protein RecO C-terminal domain-containing protein [Psychrobacter sp. BF1]
MRNQALTGYLLHQRPYQEKRALYYLFSEQFGVIHGVGKKGAPLFELLQLFATGKRDLKTFSQIDLSLISISQINSLTMSSSETDNVQLDEGSTAVDPLLYQPKSYQKISGQQQYAALYLNEILLKLLPIEDPMAVLWHHYQDSLSTLKQPLSADELRLCLRQFEQYLFQELGFALNLTHDNMQASIEAETIYRFLPDVGLVPIVASTDNIEHNNSQAMFKGSEILAMQQVGIAMSTINSWSRLHRHLIDHLLDYQPLQSRLLWQQQQRYQ